jgi:hypothetical protein
MDPRREPEESFFGDRAIVVRRARRNLGGDANGARSRKVKVHRGKEFRE